MPKAFIEAYEHFLNAKTGDEGTYSKVALDFRKVFEKSGKDFHLKLKCCTFESLCYFLSIDIDKAFPAAREALSIASKEYPADHLIKMLNESNKKDREKIENKEIPELAKLLLRIPVTEKNTFDLSRKLIDKRNFRLTDVDLEKNWEELAFILAVLLDKEAPSFYLIEEKIKQAVCTSNLRQLGVLLFIYAQKHEGSLPPPYNIVSKTTWMEKILKQQQVSWTKRGSIFRCPSIEIKAKDGFSYGINSIFMEEDSIKILKKDKVLLLSDSVHYMPGDYSLNPNYAGASYKIWAPYERFGTGTVDRNRHMGGANVLFSDGSVEWLHSSRISNDSTDNFWRNW